MNGKTSKKVILKKIWLLILSMVLILSSVLCGVIFDYCLLKEESFYGAELNIKEFKPFVIEQGLQVTSIGEYSGIYLEDGTDDVVSSVMMIVLENTSDKDLQLARIKAVYSDFVAEFEATNIPSGGSVVLLEKNRREFVQESTVSFIAENVVFFKEKMDTMADEFSFVCGDGFVDVKNIGNSEVDGTTMLFYKNKAGDTLYGGITYRARIEEKLSPGESVKVLTNHFTENNTEVMQIVNVK